MAYYKNEFDTGFVVDEKTGESTAMFTVGITAKNEAARLADDYWEMKKENIDLRDELADLRQKLAEVKEAAK